MNRIVLALTLVFAVAVSAQATLINDNFDVGNAVGTQPVGWSFGGVNSVQDVLIVDNTTLPPDSSPYAVEFDSAGPIFGVSNLQMHKPFSTTAPLVELTYKFYLSTAVPLTNFRTEIGYGSLTPQIELWTYWDDRAGRKYNNIAYRSGTTGGFVWLGGSIKLDNINGDAWNEVKIDWDTSDPNNKTFQLYLNGTEVTSGPEPFQNMTGGDPGRLRFRNPNNADHLFFIDTVSMTVIPEPSMMLILAAATLLRRKK